MLFLGADALVELLLRLAVLHAGFLQVAHTCVSFGANDTRDVLQVVEKHFPLFLLLGVLVQLVDLPHVVKLLVEVFLGVHQGVEQVAVLPVFLRLEVKVVEEFEQTLRELSNLNIAWARLNLALDA